MSSVRRAPNSISSSAFVVYAGRMQTAPAESSALSPPPAATGNRILQKLLERLFAAMVSGPSLNCRPHSSRQRIDLVQLSKFQDCAPEQLLRELLGGNRRAKISAKVPPPKTKAVKPEPKEASSEPESTAEETPAREAYEARQSVL